MTCNNLPGVCVCKNVVPWQICSFSVFAQSIASRSAPLQGEADCHVASFLAMTCRRWAGVRGCKDAMICNNLPGACVCKDAMPCKTLPGICICLGALPGQSRPGIYPPAALGIQGNCIRFPEKKQFLFRQKNQIFLAVPGDILNFYRLNYGLRQTVGEFSYHENSIFIHQYSF